MWIAKPLGALSRAEKTLALEREGVPLSQTFHWQNAAQASGARCYLVLHTDRKVGGFVHSWDDEAFECVNGPLLNWDSPESIAGEFAAFAHAVSRLSPSFRSMTLAPRWEGRECLQRRLSLLPVESTAVDQASTWVVPVDASAFDQFERTSPRMRRTLARAQKAGLCVEFLDVNEARLEAFVQGAQRFGEGKGFFVPSLKWFKALALPGAESSSDGSLSLAGEEKMSFQIVKSFVGGDETQLLVAFTRRSAHYLFGYDVRSSSSRLSTAATAHFQILEVCRMLGVSGYDLNGYTDPRDLSHPYAGVSQFKSQLGGYEVQFFCPRFEIA